MKSTQQQGKTPTASKQQQQQPIQSKQQPVQSKNANKFNDDDIREADIPYAKRNERSKYADMSKEDKMKLTLKRIEEDRLRAHHQLPLMKKQEVKKKLFVSKKKVYDLTAGYAICVCKIPDKDAYYFGLSNGVVLYFDCKTEKIVTAVKGDSPILDILALTNDKFITIDDYSTVKVYDQYKLVKIISKKAAFIGGTYNYSKILAGNENYLFFINETNDGVVKVNLVDYSVDVVHLNRS